MATNAITIMIQDGQISTAKIADDAVTQTKIAPDAINGAIEIMRLILSIIRMPVLMLFI